MREARPPNCLSWVWHAGSSRRQAAADASSWCRLAMVGQMPEGPGLLRPSWPELSSPAFTSWIGQHSICGIAAWVIRTGQRHATGGDHQSEGASWLAMALKVECFCMSSLRLSNQRLHMCRSGGHEDACRYLVCPSLHKINAGNSTRFES